MNHSKLTDIKAVLGNKDIAMKDADFTARHIDVKRSEPSDPTLVISPETEEQLHFTIKTLNKFNQPFVIIAGETGYAGAQHATDNEVHLDMSRFNQLKSISFTNGDKLNFSAQKRGFGLDEANAKAWKEELREFLDDKKLSEDELKNYTKGASIRTEAGISIGAINEILEVAHQFIPFDAGSAKIGNASIGGVVANYSFGADAKSMGSPADRCISVNSINGNGLKRTDKGAAGKLRKFSDNEAALRSDRLPLGNNPIGGQGTFAVSYEMEMSTERIPEQRHIFLIKFDSYDAVQKFRDAIEKKFPDNIRQFELMNAAAIQLVKDQNPKNYHNYFPTQEIANYYAMVDIMDSKKLDTHSNIGHDVYEFVHDLKLEEKMAAFGDVSRFSPDSAPAAPVGLVHKLRHSMSESSDILATKFAAESGAKNHKGEPDVMMHRITVDMCVPKEHYAEMLEFGKKLAEKYNMVAPVFGHNMVYAGHMHFISEERLDKIWDIKNNLTKKEAFKNEMYAKMHSLRGPSSSEHCIGQLYAEMWNKFASEEDKNMWLAVKINEDSKNIVNPNSNHFAKLFKEVTACKEGDALITTLKKLALDHNLNNTLRFLETLKIENSKTGLCK